MADLTIRGIEARLKRQLEERVRANRRSLSQEAKDLIERALATEIDNRKLGTLMSQLLAPEHRIDDDIFEVPGEISRPPEL
jgi:plasmid stability protein